MQAGISVGLLSGRKSPAVAARAAELGIAHVLQGNEDKRSAFESLLARVAMTPADAGFMSSTTKPTSRRCDTCAT